MPEASKNHDPFSQKSEIPVTGAYEVFEGSREELITLTRTGSLLQPGDTLPVIPGVDLHDSPLILHTVNAFGTETCDTCTDELETFHLRHPEIPVISLTKQSPEEIDAENAKKTEAGKPKITHRQLTIDHETAVDLGVALAPGQGADEEFWPTALRRTLALVDSHGKIIDIQQTEDQEEKPDFLRVFEAAESLS